MLHGVNHKLITNTLIQTASTTQRQRTFFSNNAHYMMAVDKIKNVCCPQKFLEYRSALHNRLKCTPDENGYQFDDQTSFFDPPRYKEIAASDIQTLKNFMSLCVV